MRSSVQTIFPAYRIGVTTNSGTLLRHFICNFFSGTVEIFYFGEFILSKCFVGIDRLLDVFLEYLATNLLLQD